MQHNQIQNYKRQISISIRLLFDFDTYILGNGQIGFYCFVRIHSGSIFWHVSTQSLLCALTTVHSPFSQAFIFYRTLNMDSYQLLINKFQCTPYQYWQYPFSSLVAKKVEQKCAQSTQTTWIQARAHHCSHTILYFKRTQSQLHKWSMVTAK